MDSRVQEKKSVFLRLAKDGFLRFQPHSRGRHTVRVFWERSLLPTVLVCSPLGHVTGSRVPGPHCQEAPPRRAGAAGGSLGAKTPQPLRRSEGASCGVGVSVSAMEQNLRRSGDTPDQSKVICYK